MSFRSRSIASMASSLGLLSAVGSHCHAADTAPMVPIRCVQILGENLDLNVPSKVLRWEDDVYVLDTNGNRVVVCDSSGAVLRVLDSVPGATPGRLLSPFDMDITPGGDIYLADTGNSRLVVYRSSGAVDSWPLSYKPRSLVICGDEVHVRSAPSASNLFDVYDAFGTHRRTAGEIDGLSEPAHIRDALNRIRTVCADGHVWFVRQTLAEVCELQPATNTGQSARCFPVRGPEVDASRSWFYGSRSAVAGALIAPAPDPRRADLVSDVCAVSNDGEAHGNYLVGGIGVWRGEIYVLVYGIVYVYLPDGTLVRRLEPVDSEGRGPLDVHGLNIDSDGSLWLWDTAHLDLAYRFTPEGPSPQLDDQEREEIAR